MLLGQLLPHMEGHSLQVLNYLVGGCNSLWPHLSWKLKCFDVHLWCKVQLHGQGLANFIFWELNFLQQCALPFILTYLAHLILFIFVVNVLKFFRGLLYIMFFKSNDVSPYLLICAKNYFKKLYQKISIAKMTSQGLKLFGIKGMVQENIVKNK